MTIPNRNSNANDSRIVGNKDNTERTRGGSSPRSSPRRRPSMHLEIVTRRNRSSSSSSSSRSPSKRLRSPSVVAMSCSTTAATTATTPMRLDSPALHLVHSRLLPIQQEQERMEQDDMMDQIGVVELDSDLDTDMRDSDDEYADALDEFVEPGSYNPVHQHHHSAVRQLHVDVQTNSSSAHDHMMDNEVTAADHSSNRNLDLKLLCDAQRSEWKDVVHMPEILTCIFFFMDRRELLVKVRLVCKQWHDISTGCTLLWHHHTFVDNPYYYERKNIDSSSSGCGGDDDDDDGDQEEEEAGQQSNTIATDSEGRLTKKPRVCESAQLYPVDKTMWHDMGDSISMSRRNLQGRWTFLNYKEYFIEQCLLDRCTTSAAPSSAASAGSGADGSPQSDSIFQRIKAPRSKDRLGPMFLEDKHTMSIIRQVPPQPTYRHTLTVLPCTPESEAVRYRGISREQFNTHYDNQNAIYKREYADRTLVDPMNPSDKVYFIGGLHNTMTTQPPELAEDFVNVLQVVDSNCRRSGPSSSSTPADSNPASPTSSIGSVTSPLAQGLRRLLTFGSPSHSGSSSSSNSGNGCSGVFGGVFGGQSSISKRMSPFKRVRVVGKPPHIGKHTSVLFDNVDINGRSGPKILIFGGVEDDLVTNNLYHYDLNSDTWFLEQFGSDETVPSPRTNHSAVAVGDYMYVVGGGIGQNMVPTSEIWRYHVHQHRWEQVHYTGDVDEFTPRLGIVTCVVNQKILIYGGGYWHQTSMVDRYWREKYRDMFILDTCTNVLSVIDQSNSDIAPQVGTFPASALIGTQWYIVGGAFDNKISYDIFAFDTVTYKWRKFNQSFYGGDSLSCCHFVTSDQMNKLLILGGYCYSPLSNYQVFSLRYKDIMDSNHLLVTNRDSSRFCSGVGDVSHC